MVKGKDWKECNNVAVMVTGRDDKRSTSVVQL
jgi:hypothetical protein